MAKTERVLGGVIVTGMAACIGLIVWPAGPTTANALAPLNHPVKTPVSSPAEVVAVPETLDPLTESVVRGPARRTSGAPIAFASLEGGADLRTSGNIIFGGEADAVPVADDVSRVLLSRLVVLDSEPKLVADFDGDSELSDGDTDQFQQLWESGDPKADMNGDGEIDATDFAAFVDAFNGQARTPGVESMIRLHFTTSDGQLQSGGGSGEVEIQLGSQVQFTFEGSTAPGK